MKPNLPHLKKAEQMRNAYDETAEFYDSRYKVIQYLKYGILLHRIIIPHSLPKIEISGPLLDNGGGTGLFLKFLQDLSIFLSSKKSIDENVQLILEFTVYLIKKNFGVTPNSIQPIPLVINDISFGMLQLAQKFQTSRSLYGLVACDSSFLPFRTSQFSAIIAFTVFQNVINLKQAIAESFRVVKNFGTLAASILEKSGNKLKFAELLGEFFNVVHPVHYEKERTQFQKMIVQNGKYSQFHDLGKVEDFFLIAKKSVG